MDSQIICFKGFIFLKNEVQAFVPLKLHSYWTEVHPIVIQCYCSRIIADES